MSCRTSKNPSILPLELKCPHHVQSHLRVRLAKTECDGVLLTIVYPISHSISSTHPKNRRNLRSSHHCTSADLGLWQQGLLQCPPQLPRFWDKTPGSPAPQA